MSLWIFDVLQKQRNGLGK